MSLKDLVAKKPENKTSFKVTSSHNMVNNLSNPINTTMRSNPFKSVPVFKENKKEDEF